MPPGASQQPARPGDALLQRRVLQHVAGENSGLGLRLTVAAHRSVHHHPAIVQPCCGGVEGVKRLFAGRQRQQVARVEAERGPAVLPDNPALRQHHAAAEFVIKALNKGDRQSAFIDNPHPYGIARAFARAPRGSLLVVDVIR